MEADLIVSCPYNPSHRIRKAKLMAHVAKCKKSNKVENKVSCPVDTSHIVDRDQLEEHIASCPSLGNLVHDVDCLHANENTEAVSIISSKTVENWDEEPEVPPYNPMEVSENKKVLRPISGLTKSERKKFRNKERMRLAHLNAEDLTLDASCSMKDNETYSLYSSRHTNNVLSDANTLSANDLDKSAQSFKQDASIQTNISHEFDDPFHRTLYNEFAPENDDFNNLEQELEQSLHHAELFNKSLNPEATSAKNSFHINKKKDFLNFDQNEETKIELDVTGGSFNTNDLKQEKSECAAASTSVSCERDDLLTLLKNLNATKMESVKEKLNQSDKDVSQKEWDEMFDRFNILTNVQNAAAEESAQLLQQLSKLKLRQEVPPKK